MSEPADRSPGSPAPRQWAAILQGLLGCVLLGLALANASVYWPQVELHDDGLTLVGQAGTGGLLLGAVLARTTRPRR